MWPLPGAHSYVRMLEIGMSVGVLLGTSLPPMVILVSPMMASPLYYCITDFCSSTIYEIFSDYYFATSEMQSTVMSVSVSLSVWPLAYLRNHTAEVHSPNFCACCLWP